MYRYSSSIGLGSSRERQMRKVLLAAIAVLLVVILVLVIVLIRTSRTGNSIRTEVSSRISSDLSNAITMVNRMDRSTTSKTLSDVGKIRQYIYSMEQMNRLCISVEHVRLISDDVFSALYSDLENFESLTQGAKASTLDAQALLLTHLTNLQTLFSQ